MIRMWKTASLVRNFFQRRWFADRFIGLRNVALREKLTSVLDIGKGFAAGGEKNNTYLVHLT